MQYLLVQQGEILSIFYLQIEKQAYFFSYFGLINGKLYMKKTQPT